MSLKSFEEKLDNFNGLYHLNLAVEEEREYYLESIGGEDNLRKHFPVIYNAYKKSLNTAEKCMQSNSDFCDDNNVEVHFSNYDINADNLEQNLNREERLQDRVNLWTTLSGSFLDKSLSVTNTSQAKKFNVAINGKIYDPNSSRLAFMEIHKSFEQVNQIDLPCVSERTYYIDELNNRLLKLKFTVSVFDESNNLIPYVYTNKKQLGNLQNFPIDNIHIDAPVSSHPDTNEIRILYGRTAQNLENPDYIYASNNADKNKGILWTIIPIKGHVSLRSVLSGDKYNSFEKLTKPDKGEYLSRSILQYDNKDWKIFRNDLNDEKLYNLLTDTKSKIFYVETGENNVETLYFDFFNPNWKNTDDRYYDWSADIDKASTDNFGRICYLIGGFEYDICKKNLKGEIIEPGTSYQIEFHSVKPEDLPKNRSYYTYAQGSDTIYIPPIHLWWGCYSKETSIMLSNNTYKRADEINIGDELICYGNKKLTVNNIYYGEKEKELICIKTDKDAEIKVSMGHPMLMEGGVGRAAERLRVGDKIMMADNTAANVISVTTELYDDIVYNFSFEGEEEGNYLIANKFYSGDFYAQNKSENKSIPLIGKQKELCVELKALEIFLSNDRCA